MATAKLTISYKT